MHLSSSNDYLRGDHVRFRRLSNPAIQWEARLKPLRSWCAIIGEAIVGLLLGVGMLMAFFWNLV